MSGSDVPAMVTLGEPLKEPLKGSLPGASQRDSLEEPLKGAIWVLGVRALGIKVENFGVLGLLLFGLRA